jgi:homoserine O-acetyltransferase
VVDQIGGGLSTSPHNAAGSNASIATSKFPSVRVSDDVAALERLLREHFGIRSLELIVCGSMGAQQNYEWIVWFPDMVERAAPIAGTARNTPHDFLFTKSLIVSAGRRRTGWKIVGSRHALRECHGSAD